MYHDYNFIKQGGSGTTSFAWTYIKVCRYRDCFCKNLNIRSLTPRWPLTPHLLRSCVTLPKDHCVQVPWKYIKVCGYSDLFCKKNWTKGHWPLDDLWPHICWGHMCDSTKDHCVQVPWKYITVCGYSDPFCKNLNQRSMTPRWPLITHLLRSYVWLYPRIIVSKSHENTSKYVDTVNFFSPKNLNQRSLTPRWPLTPHLLGSHVWLYPRIIAHYHSTNSSWLPKTSRKRLVNIDEPHMTQHDLIFSLACASRLTIIYLH